MANLLFLIVLLVIFGYAVMKSWSISRNSGLEHPLRDSMLAILTGAFLESLSIGVIWRTGDNHPVFESLIWVLQFPGLMLGFLLGGLFGFGVHGERSQVKIFYTLVALINALTYSMVVFALYALIQRSKRASL